MIESKVFALILIAVIVSFLGFCVENFFISYSHGFIDNRNMILPFLFGYGLSILAYHSLFGTPNNPLFFGKEVVIARSSSALIYCFSIAFLGVSIGEVILGTLTEKLCGIIWWDYSAIPLHLTRYTSVPTSMGFAFLITVFMKYFFEPLLKYFSGLNHTSLSIIALSLAALLSLDMINSAVYMFRHHETLKLWRLDFEMPLKEFIYIKHHKI